jgi:hypothetical protein
MPAKTPVNPAPFIITMLCGLFGVAFNLIMRGTNWVILVVFATMMFFAGLSGLRAATTKDEE